MSSIVHGSLLAVQIVSPTIVAIVVVADIVHNSPMRRLPCPFPHRVVVPCNRVSTSQAEDVEKTNEEYNK